MPSSFSHIMGTIRYILPKTLGCITKEFGKETWASKPSVTSPYQTPKEILLNAPVWMPKIPYQTPW